MVLLTLMAFSVYGIVRLRTLFGVVILGGIYSFMMASVLIVLDAVDVAMTEAAVGAGMSTVLMLGVLYLTKHEESEPTHTSLLPLGVAALTAAMLIFGTYDLPPFGSADTPVHQNVAPRYLEKSIEETTVPNVVTSVLASYRGFDTLGETTVIFTAGVAVILLLGGRRRQVPAPAPADKQPPPAKKRSTTKRRASKRRTAATRRTRTRKGGAA